MEEDRTYARRWWTLGVLCIGLVVIGVDNTILNVALPSIVRDLGASGSSGPRLRIRDVPDNHGAAAGMIGPP